MIKRVGDHFELAFGSLLQALQRAFPERFQESDQVWSELSIRRNNIEQSIKTSLYIWSRSVQDQEWVDILSSELTNKRFDALQTTEPAVLLSNKSSPLYLSDLAAILKDGRVMNHLSARRPLIISNLHKLNALRKDAHGNSPSFDEIETFRQVCDELESDFFIP